MDPETFETTFTEIFRVIFNLPDLDLRDEMTAADVPGWDSLNHIMLIGQIEEEFGLFLTNEELEGLADVGALKAVVRSKVC